MALHSANCNDGEDRAMKEGNRMRTSVHRQSPERTLEGWVVGSLMGCVVSLKFLFSA
jgi:hypothetical protein